MKPFGVYLSARFALADDLRRYRVDLLAHGFTCTARWLDGDLGGSAVMAEVDADDVDRSHALVNFTDAPLPFSPHKFAARGGRHVEFGRAHALRIPCIVCGPRENVFHYHPRGVIVVPSWPDALEALEQLRATRDPRESEILP